MLYRRLFALLPLVCATSALAQLTVDPVLPPELPWHGKSLELVVPADHEWVTPFEVSVEASLDAADIDSSLGRTPRYVETIRWLERLVAAAPELALVSIGKSAEGRDIWMVIASREGATTPKELRENGRPILLAHAGIHSGEIDGKDAGMMLLRDMTVGGIGGVGGGRGIPGLSSRPSRLLDRVNFLFIPILSVDGHERFSRFSRINQRGPAEMGWRTNARNLNLNRDYTKLETEEVRALVETIGIWRPDLYLDLHVTDGADYQYDITFGYNGPHAWSPHIARWLDEVFTPATSAALERMGHIPGPLTFGVNGRDMSEGTVQWTASPRFSNGWGDARHLPSVLVENHSLKPYRQRVLGTYVLLESALATLGRGYRTLREAREEDEQAAPAEIVLDWAQAVGEPAPTVAFKGVRSELFLSPISGAPQVRWTGEPVDEEIPLAAMTRAKVKARRPAHYYIPAAWYPIADKLARQGVEVTRLAEPTTLEVEMLRLPDATLDVANTPFEGRARYTSGTPAFERTRLTLPANSFRVATAQPLGTLAVLMLEPQSPDSLFQWGYFAEILQRTEYVESYVMEPTAQAMLEADPALAAEFERKLLDDKDFAGDPRARLQWFYEKTPFFDSRHRLYPIARSVQ